MNNYFNYASSPISWETFVDVCDLFRGGGNKDDDLESVASEGDDNLSVASEVDDNVSVASEDDDVSSVNSDKADIYLDIANLYNDFATQVETVESNEIPSVFKDGFYLFTGFGAGPSQIDDLSSEPVPVIKSNEFAIVPLEKKPICIFDVTKGILKYIRPETAGKQNVVEQEDELSPLMLLAESVGIIVGNCISSINNYVFDNSFSEAGLFHQHVFHTINPASLTYYNSGDIALRDELDDELDSTISDNLSYLLGVIKNIFAQTQEDAKFQSKMVQLMKKLENGGVLTDEDLILIQNAMMHKPLDRDNLSERMRASAKDHPMMMRAFVSIISAGAFFLSNGNVTTTILVDSLMKKFLEENVARDERNGAKKAVQDIIKTVVAAYINPNLGVAIASGNALEAMPEDMRAPIIGALGAQVAFSAGVNPGNSGSVGLAAYLFYKNPRLFVSITKDLRNAWNVMKEDSCLTIIKKSGLYVKNQVELNFRKVFQLAKEGKKEERSEALTRIASIALGILAATFSLYSLPLTLGLFYLVNKYFEPKYEGPASFTNESFRLYVLEDVNMAKNKVERLLEILNNDENVTCYNNVIKAAINPHQ